MPELTSENLAVWGQKGSINTQKVMWLLDELNLSFKLVPIGGFFHGLDSPEFLAMNPHGRIPVIVDKGNVLWESHSILRYLAASYGEKAFWNKDPAVRAKIEAWMDWLQTVLQPNFLLGVFFAYYRTPEKDRNWKLINSSIANCSKHFTLLDNQIKKNDFLCGELLSLADIAIGSIFYRYFELDIDRPKIPQVEAWYDGLKERPAYQKNVMIPFDDVRGRLSY